MAETSPRRIFKFEEARDLLGAVRARTEEALEQMSSLEISMEEDDESREEKLEKAAVAVFGSWAEEISALGIEVKGPWLVDFDSGAGYYCWKWPEESLEFFHGYEEGFAGRVRLQ